MSDDLDIRGGGAVAVDTETLRSAATQFRSLAFELEEIGALVGSAGSLAFSVGPAGWESANSVEGVRGRVDSSSETARLLVADLLSAAAAYESIELAAEREISARAGNLDDVSRIDARLRAIAREHPEAARLARGDTLAHWLRWPAELSRQAPGALWWLAPGFASLAIPSAWGVQRVIGVAGAGTVERDARLGGPSKSVVVTPLAPAASASAPATLAIAAQRIPGGADARVRVERYTMPDGARQFVVYVAGTQEPIPGTDEPFDMASNVELYTGERSASYEATLSALAQAGIEPGDTVHAFGHSQGAMIAAHVALEAGFDTQTLVTFGSPVESDLGPDTLSVSVRHRDDPVAAFAGGGHAGAVGAPGSFIAERTADPALGMHDLQLPAHGIVGYTETAALLDGSRDPRMDGVRSLLRDLEGAASVDVIEYGARREP